MQERRAEPRFQVELNAQWETLKSQGRGSITDLSSNGCFVLTGGEFTVGELACLQIKAAEQYATVWGEIAYTTAEIGFAMRFVFAGEDRRALDALLDELGAEDV